MKRLDEHEVMPEGVDEYKSHYGWHFSKKLCEHAVKNMKDKEGKKIQPYTKDQLEQLLKQHNIQLQNNEGYDAVYIANMCKADYLGRSVASEQHLAQFVKDFLDDPDGHSEKALDHYYADCIGTGHVIIWEDML